MVKAIKKRGRHLFMLTSWHVSMNHVSVSTGRAVPPATAQPRFRIIGSSFPQLSLSRFPTNSRTLHTPFLRSHHQLPSLSTSTTTCIAIPSFDFTSASRPRRVHRVLPSLLPFSQLVLGRRVNGAAPEECRVGIGNDIICRNNSAHNPSPRYLTFFATATIHCDT